MILYFPVEKWLTLTFLIQWLTNQLHNNIYHFGVVNIPKMRSLYNPFFAIQQWYGLKNSHSDKLIIPLNGEVINAFKYFIYW